MYIFFKLDFSFMKKSQLGQETIELRLLSLPRMAIAIIKTTQCLTQYRWCIKTSQHESTNFSNQLTNARRYQGHPRSIQSRILGEWSQASNSLCHFLSRSRMTKRNNRCIYPRVRDSCSFENVQNRQTDVGSKHVCSTHWLCMHRLPKKALFPILTISFVKVIPLWRMQQSVWLVSQLLFRQRQQRVSEGGEKEGVEWNPRISHYQLYRGWYHEYL